MLSADSVANEGMIICYSKACATATALNYIKVVFSLMCAGIAAGVFLVALGLKFEALLPN